MVDLHARKPVFHGKTVQQVADIDWTQPGFPYALIYAAQRLQAKMKQWQRDVTPTKWASPPLAWTFQMDARAAQMLVGEVRFPKHLDYLPVYYPEDPLEPLMVSGTCRLTLCTWDPPYVRPPDDELHATSSTLLTAELLRSSIKVAPANVG